MHQYEAGRDLRRSSAENRLILLKTCRKAFTPARPNPGSEKVGGSISP
jgi:hypothetical protein